MGGFVMLYHFWKMEGLGNDYLYIHTKSDLIINLKEKIKQISSLHYGVGSDGVIFIEESSKADFYMRMFNRDGSEGKMCGNGIRCVAKFVYENGLTNKTNITIETLSGIKELSLEIKNDIVINVTVNMGKASLSLTDLPINLEKETEMINYPFKFNDNIYYFTAVSLGNPHLVCFLDSIENLDVNAIGLDFHQTLAFLNDQVNIEFVKVINKEHIQMRVYERGSKETMACGTGACASVVAGYINGYTNNHVRVSLLGGDLDIIYQEDQSVLMKGPARKVFEGQIEL